MKWNNSFIWIRDIQNLDTGDFPGGPVVKNPLPIQGTWVWSLVQEDSTYHRASKSMHRTYGALEPMPCKKRSYHNERPMNSNEQ